MPDRGKDTLIPRVLEAQNRMRGTGDGVGDASKGEVSRAVIEAVAEREQVPATELSPPEYESLHDVIDPEALDRLFRQKLDGTRRGPGTVTFTFCEYEITVESDGQVAVD